MPPRVTVISVSYNSEAVLGNMLSSLASDVDAVVVDNLSSDQSVQIARDNGARVVNLEQNLGFGCGCNAGAVNAQTDYLFFLNPDTVATAGAIDALVTAMDAHPHCAAANPRIVGSNGKPSFKRRSTLLPRADWDKRGWPEQTREVCVLSGAAMFVRRSAFEAVGGFDPKIFLYHEDDDLSLRLKAGIGPLLFVADATIKHLEGRSSKRSATVAAWKSYHLARSRVYAMNKHKRPNPYWSSLRIAVGKCLSISTVLSARKRAQAFGFLRGVLSSRQENWFQDNA